MTVDLQYPWVRLTCPIGLEPERNAAGWTLPYGRMQNDQVVPLSGRRATPVLILLGERGIGKTRVLAQEHEALQTEGERSVLVEFGRLTTTRARREVDDALASLNKGVLHLLLDGIDDAPPSLEADLFIGEALEDLDEGTRQNLRLRISCRTSRRSTVLEERLRGTWGPDLPAITVAGLTRDDVTTAAELHGLDGEAFVTRLEHKHLVPLVSGPVTLVPLLKAAAGGQPLPGNAVEAYQLACTQLCTERPPATYADAHDRTFSPGELIALARKAAAALQFLARDGLTLEAGSAESLSFADLAQGAEPVDGGETVRCTEAGYLALMHAGMLVGAGDGRWSFAHRSLQEFLAAEYLSARAVETPVRESLLLVGDGDRRQAATRHRDVAAWLALSDHQLFKCILHSDPFTLLLADLSVLPHEDRADVFDALVDQVRGGAVVQVGWSALGRLAGDLTPARIAPLLRPDESMEVVHLALSVANACRCSGLTDPLLEFASNNAITDGLRTLAMNAIVEDLRDDQAHQLRSMITDPDPDVASHVIDLLWPDNLSVEELLDNLPAPYENHIGHARSLLRRVPDLLPDESLKTGVEWATRILRGEEPKPAAARDGLAVAEVATSTLVRAVTAFAAGSEDTSDLAKPLGAALLALTDGDYKDEPIAESEALQQALRISATARRALARVVLHRASDDQVAQLYWSRASPFHGGEDSGYWALQWTALPQSAHRLLQFPLREPATDVEDWEAAYELGEQHPELHALIKHWYVSPNPTENNWVRKAHYRREAWQRKQQESPEPPPPYDEVALRAAVERVRSDASDLREAWRAVLYNLYCKFQGSTISPPTRLDVSGAPHYPDADDPLYQPLIAAAKIVLTRTPVLTPGDVPLHGVNPWNHAPELYALGLLVRVCDVPELEAKRWCGLSLALVCATDTARAEPESCKDLLGRCAAQARGLLDEVLPQTLQRLHILALQETLKWLSSALGSAYGEIVLDWVGDSDREVDDQAKVLGVLANADNAGAYEVLTEAVEGSVGLHRWGLDSRPVRQWLGAVIAVTQLRHVYAWTKVIDLIESDPRLAAPLFGLFVETHTIGPWPLEDAHISSDDLGRLYVVMARHVPMPDGFAPGGIVGSQHELLRLYQSLPTFIFNRDDSDALDTLRALARQYPESRQLRALADNLAHAIVDRSWRPVSNVQQFVAVTVGQLSRVVNDQHQLREVVVESLERLQQRLLADNGWSPAIWNQRQIDQKPPATGKKTLWWPTWENDLSDFVATFLSYDLADRGLIVNREVQVTRPGLKGSRTDIEIQAGYPGSVDPEPLTVIIETKGCWNHELPTGLSAQLVEKYLLRPGKRAGIYLVGYFDDDAWAEDEGGNRGRPHEKHSLKSIQVAQGAIAEREREQKSVSVSSFVLDCRLPAARLRNPSD